MVCAVNKEPKDNPRFVVTNLKQNPQWIYEQVYCQRGDVENRIKELHDGMQIGRTSCSDFLANTFRVLLTAAAYVLMQEMRLHLSPTRHARAQVSSRSAGQELLLVAPLLNLSLFASKADCEPR